jgi:GNAT superfamily N-acetyltransferase
MKELMNLTLRRGTLQDAKVCGAICYEAFKTIAETHHFTPDFPSVDVAVELLTWMLGHAGFYAVVAELGGELVGSNFLDERNCIAGVGPITVDPSVQHKTIGRQLMEDVHHRIAQKNLPGVRLIQAGYHMRSLSLYAKLGYDVREPLACLQGPAINGVMAGYGVRPATPGDLEGCNRVCRQVHGHDRGGELLDAVRQAAASVVEHDGRITGYATTLGFFGHAVGESNRELQALIGAAQTFAGPGFLLPIRNTELFRWCLQRGLRVTQPMTLMSLGLYNEPAGAFLPSVVY